MLSPSAERAKNNDMLLDRDGYIRLLDFIQKNASMQPLKLM